MDIRNYLFLYKQHDQKVVEVVVVWQEDGLVLMIVVFLQGNAELEELLVEEPVSIPFHP